MKKKRVSLLMVACANAGEAKRIARALVRERLAACVSVYPRVDSVYRWKGRRGEAKEAVIIVKTTKARAAAAVKKIKELHSYELPSIVSIDDSVGDEVAAWFNESVGVYSKKAKKAKK